MARKSVRIKLSLLRDVGNGSTWKSTIANNNKDKVVIRSVTEIS